MPNHISNRLVFDGPSDKVAELREFLRNEREGECVDFNAIVPMPQCLRDPMEFPHHIVTAVAAFVEAPLSENEAIAMLQRDSRSRAQFKFEDPTEQELFDKGVSNYRECGYIYWYDWCAEKWGTKWNAYNSKETEEGVEFETAWSAVPVLVSLLARYFPDVRIGYVYADEDAGFNTGRFMFHNNAFHKDIPEGGSFEAYEMYFELRPEAREEYTLKDGEYEYNDPFEKGE